MEVFQYHGTILQGSEAKKIVKNYNKIAKVLLEFEMLYHRGWLRQVRQQHFTKCILYKWVYVRQQCCILCMQVLPCMSKLLCCNNIFTVESYLPCVTFTDGSCQVRPAGLTVGSPSRNQGVVCQLWLPDLHHDQRNKPHVQSGSGDSSNSQDHEGQRDGVQEPLLCSLCESETFFHRTLFLKMFMNIYLRI